MDRPATCQSDLQGAYHHRLFHAIHDWDRFWDRIIRISGDVSRARAFGMDQMGHFGPPGCDIVVAEIVRRFHGRSEIVLAELGCGFGGVLRYLIDGLRDHHITVRLGIGIDLVLDHAQVFALIEHERRQSVAHPVVGDAHALPFRDSSLDVVVCTGSLPHFADAGTVLAEAARVLQPGGVLVMTEETSLRNPELEVSVEFRRRHPPDIFFFADVEERVRQLRAAGFVEWEIRDLSEWACSLLRDRLKVMRLFFGDVAEIFGAAEAAALIDTLTVARDEFLRGALTPALVTARLE